MDSAENEAAVSDAVGVLRMLTPEQIKYLAWFRRFELYQLEVVFNQVSDQGLHDVLVKAGCLTPRRLSRTARRLAQQAPELYPTMFNATPKLMELVRAAA